LLLNADPEIVFDLSRRTEPLNGPFPTAAKVLLFNSTFRKTGALKVSALLYNLFKFEAGQPEFHRFRLRLASQRLFDVKQTPTFAAALMFSNNLR